MNRRAGDARLDAIERHLHEGHERMQKLEDGQSRILQHIADNRAITNEIRDIMAAGRVGLKVLGGVSVAVKWMAGVVVGLAAIWGGIHAAASNWQEWWPRK